MKKLLFFSVVILKIGFTSYSQNLRLGLSAGTSFANYHAKADGESDKGSLTGGFSGGVLFNIPVGDHFSLQPGVNFIPKITETYQKISDYVSVETLLTTNHLEIPLSLLYNTNRGAGNFFIGAGPSLTVGLFGKKKYDTYEGYFLFWERTNSSSQDVQFGDTDGDDLKGVDLGADFLTGYCFSSGLFISVNYNLGLSNLVPGTSEGTLKSSYFGIKIGYLFRGN